MIVKEYFLINWPLILILLAFIISLITTVFLDKKQKTRMYILIATIFVLSISVFVEFYVDGNADYILLRTILAALRYSATPFIMAQIIFALVKRLRWFIFIPAGILMIVDIVSIFVPIVFKIDENNALHHGPVGFLPFVMVGLYSIFLIYLLIKRSNKTLMEIVYIIFLAFALGTGLLLVAIYQKQYSGLFCITIAISLFVYFEFSVLQLTKKDSLTGLLNRHAYFADVNHNPKSITAIISIDMNGLKAINDASGHAAGDEALETLSACFVRPLKSKQSCYRIGGDEFLVVCRKTSKEDVMDIVGKIRENVSETKYTCSIGYSFNPEGNKPISNLLKESDEMMYLEKEQYYQDSSKERRKK